MWRVDERGAYSFSDGIDPAQATLFSAMPDRDYAPAIWERFRRETVLSEKVLEYTRDETAYLEKHARGALKLLENGEAAGKRITVAPKKKDGKDRRKGTYPPGTVITFTE